MGIDEQTYVRGEVYGWYSPSETVAEVVCHEKAQLVADTTGQPCNVYVRVEEDVYRLYRTMHPRPERAAALGIRHEEATSD